MSEKGKKIRKSEPGQKKYISMSQAKKSVSLRQAKKYTSLTQAMTCLSLRLDIMPAVVGNETSTVNDKWIMNFKQQVYL